MMNEEDKKNIEDIKELCSKMSRYIEPIFNKNVTDATYSVDQKPEVILRVYMMLLGVISIVKPENLDLFFRSIRLEEREQIYRSLQGIDKLLNETDVTELHLRIFTEGENKEFNISILFIEHILSNFKYKELRTKEEKIIALEASKNISFYYNEAAGKHQERKKFWFWVIFSLAVLIFGTSIVFVCFYYDTSFADIWPALLLKVNFLIIPIIALSFGVRRYAKHEKLQLIYEEKEILAETMDGFIQLFRLNKLGDAVIVQYLEKYLSRFLEPDSLPEASSAFNFKTINKVLELAEKMKKLTKE